MVIRIVFLIFFAMLSDIYSYAATPPSPLPRTGQTECYQSKQTGIIPCTGTGQDGDTITGVVWPKPRFADNGNQTMTDRLTGLVWTKDANIAKGLTNWQQALDCISNLNRLNYLGYNDWRLPNIIELESLVNKGPNLAEWLKQLGFSGVMAEHFWSSTTYASYTKNSWSINIYGGIVASRSKQDGSYVWPVRNVKSGILSLPKTGQTSCHDGLGDVTDCTGTRQDGELQTGTAWPSPRFIDNADQTITDSLTGLIWSKNGKAPGPTSCAPGTHKNWQEALDYIKCLNAHSFLGKKEWRLPNRNELASLVNYGSTNISAWLNTQGFNNVEADSYWSSTTFTYPTWNTWRVGMHDGAVTTEAHRRSINVWPVQGGK